MTSPSPKPEADVVDLLEAAAGLKPELTLEHYGVDLKSLLIEAAKVISWGRRRDEVLVDTLSMFRTEFFNLAVSTEKEARAQALLDRRLEFKALSEGARSKVRYIEQVLGYSGETPLTKAPEKTKPINGG